MTSQLLSYLFYSNEYVRTLRRLRTVACWLYITIYIDELYKVWNVLESEIHAFQLYQFSLAAYFGDIDLNIKYCSDPAIFGCCHLTK